MKENQQNPSAVAEVSEKKEAPAEGIDFGSISALANSDFKPEPFGKRLGYAILEKSLALGLFILGFLVDIIKAAFAVVRGIFYGAYALVRGIFRFVRGIVRMCKEGDKFVKMSTFAQGLQNIRGGQLGDGIVFAAVELVFILFMILFGGNALRNFFVLGEIANGMELPQNTSIKSLVSGVLVFLAIGAYVFVWYSGMKSAYDNYVIHNNFRFMQARADQVEVIENIQDYPEFADESGTKFKGRRQIYKIARETYGFPELSARYISYIEFKQMEEMPLALPSRIGVAIASWFYKGYDKVRNKAAASKWSSTFGKFLDWHYDPVKTRFGYNHVRQEALAGLNRYRHTYDKYNNYLSYVRDSESLLRVLDDPELLEKAYYAEDVVSQRNGIEAIPHGTYVKPKVAASRLVGAFECPYNDAVTASDYYGRALKEKAKTGVEPIEKIRRIAQNLHGRLDDFVRVNRKERIEGVQETLRLYTSYEELRDLYASGKAVFIQTLSEKTELAQGRVLISRYDARALYREMTYAKKVYGNDEAKVKEYMERHSAPYSKIVERFETYPFHDQPMRFKKKMKQYTDEKFSVTVLTLPVLGALITCVVPLLVSIFIAFTDYYGIRPNGSFPRGSINGATGNFDWSFIAWEQMFGGAVGGANLGSTFTYILGWTMIWALFATFSNYILGIVLALLINKKSIKFKKVFRTFFVISIAVPQFITLLSMRIILGVGGPIHEWFLSNGWATRNTFWLNDPANNALSAKITLILVNVWIGIPYTMLSTSGILMNIPDDLYESASIDGAGPWTQFWKITMPYILFVTGPSLLTTFIGNINNFNVIYFLTGGLPKPGRGSSIALNSEAGLTDLLITFLYKLTVNGEHKLYDVGSVIGIMTFAICAFFSLIMYARMGSTKNEEAFQ